VGIGITCAIGKNPGLTHSQEELLPYEIKTDSCGLLYRPRLSLALNKAPQKQIFSRLTFKKKIFPYIACPFHRACPTTG